MLSFVDIEVGVTYEVLVVACTSAGCTSWEDKTWPWAHLEVPYHLVPGMNCAVVVWVQGSAMTILCVTLPVVCSRERHVDRNSSSVWQSWPQSTQRYVPIQSHPSLLRFVPIPIHPCRASIPVEIHLRCHPFCFRKGGAYSVLWAQTIDGSICHP